MADREHDVPAPGIETEIRHEDWSVRDLSGQTFERTSFVDVDVTESMCEGTAFTECRFADCRFNASTFARAAFVNCTFTRCTFWDTRFLGCKLVGSRFERCSLGVLTVDGGDWSFVAMPAADLRKATFTGVWMREADLTGARLQEATVQHVDLSGASLARADLSGADLRGSDLSSVDPLSTPLRGAKIDLSQAITLATALGVQVLADLRP